MGVLVSLTSNPIKRYQLKWLVILRRLNSIVIRKLVKLDSLTGFRDQEIDICEITVALNPLIGNLASITTKC